MHKIFGDTENSQSIMSRRCRDENGEWNTGVTETHIVIIGLGKYNVTAPYELGNCSPQER